MHHLSKFLIPVLLIIASGLLFLPQKPSQIAYGCTGPDSKATGYDPTATTGTFEGRLVNVPPINPSEVAQVLGDASDKRIEVNLGEQKVTAFEGNNKVYEFIVSTGKWAPTPTGTFTIQRKVPSQVMSGGNKSIGTYYYLPNVPYVMFFGNDQIPWSRGFSFHGTYWHNNFGHPMSHGCVNMKTPEAEQLYNWAPMGTKVVIY